jgi:hypothetical protein
MRFTSIALLLRYLIPTTSALVQPLHISPFSPAQDQISSLTNDTDSANDAISLQSRSDLLLQQRQYCAAGFNPCTALSASLACCSTDSLCALDYAGRIACCPIGSYCTGTVPLPAAASGAIAAAAPSLALTTPIAAGAGAGLQTVTIISTLTSPGTLPGTAAVAQATPTISYVSNAYFPYPYLPNTFPNSGACLAAYSSCAAYFSICTADLGGGAGYAVTISAPGGAGVTLAPGAVSSLGSVSAASVCSSLSSVACGTPGATGGCAIYGSGTSTAAKRAVGELGTMAVGVVVVLLATGL